MTDIYITLVFRAPEADTVAELRKRYGAPAELHLFGDASTHRVLEHDDLIKHPLMALPYAFEHQHNLFAGLFRVGTLEANWREWATPGTLTFSRDGVPHELEVTTVQSIVEVPADQE